MFDHVDWSIVRTGCYDPSKHVEIFTSEQRVTSHKTRIIRRVTVFVQWYRLSCY